jgi:hypothetical protein
MNLLSIETRKYKNYCDHLKRNTTSGQTMTQHIQERSFRQFMSQAEYSEEE